MLKSPTFLPIFFIHLPKKTKYFFLTKRSLAQPPKYYFLIQNQISQYVNKNWQQFKVFKKNILFFSFLQIFRFLGVLYWSTCVCVWGDQWAPKPCNFFRFSLSPTPASQYSPQITTTWSMFKLRATHRSLPYASLYVLSLFSFERSPLCNTHP